MCLSDKDILDYIDTNPGLIAKSGVIMAHLRLRGKTDSVLPWRKSSVCEG